MEMIASNADLNSRIWQVYDLTNVTMRSCNWFSDVKLGNEGAGSPNWGKMKSPR